MFLVGESIVDRPNQPVTVIIELFFVMAAKAKVKNLAEFTVLTHGSKGPQE